MKPPLASLPEHESSTLPLELVGGAGKLDERPTRLLCLRPGLFCSCLLAVANPTTSSGIPIQAVDPWSAIVFKSPGGFSSAKSSADAGRLLTLEVRLSASKKLCMPFTDASASMGKGSAAAGCTAPLRDASGCFPVESSPAALPPTRRWTDVAADLASPIRLGGLGGHVSMPPLAAPALTRVSAAPLVAAPT